MSSDTPLSILVIEDSADTQANVKDILELDGHSAIAALSCAEALSRDDWSSISAILLDRKLPDGTAEEMLPRLRELAPHAPVVIATGFPDVQGAINALREGAYDYLLKPIDPEDLRATLRRIAERKRAEDALHEHKERLQAILSTAADAIITIDSQGTIHGVNPAAERIFGYSRTEMVGQNISMLMPSPYSEQHDTYLRRYLDTGIARIIGIGREVVGRRKDGSTFPVGLAVSEMKHQEMFTGIVRDISAVKELQKQVLEIAAEEDRRIGHELHDNTQQQLTGLGLLAQTLAESLSDVSEQHAKMASRLADGIREAANHVHFLSRGLVPVDVDAEGLRASLTDLAARVNDQYGVACEFHCTGTIGIPDNFVATHLYRIAQEAVNNAIKHGRAGRISMSLVESRGAVTLAVRDDGVGICGRVERQPGMGLRIMDYRAGLIGATLQVVPGPGGGTLVACTVLR